MKETCTESSAVLSKLDTKILFWYGPMKYCMSWSEEETKKRCDSTRAKETLEMWELVGPEHEFPMKGLIRKEVEQPQIDK